MASAGYKQGTRVGLRSVDIFLGAMLVLICPGYHVTCQGFAGCRESYFLTNGECRPCPDYCITCITDTNCTKCSDNNYGPFCQHACEEECTDHCHKEYGYCTYGCVDGRFPEKDSGHCTKCPSHCTICKSSVECIVCQPGNYGNSCENQCSNHCSKCDQRSGHCLVCANGYFSKDGQCHSCPDGCAVCYGNNKCSGCNNGYLMLYDGQCIRKCPRNETGTYPVTYDTHKSEIKDMFTDGSPNIGSGQNVVLSTIGPCVTYTPFQSNLDYLSEDDGTDAGAVLLMYECIHTYRPLNGSFYGYKSECNTTTLSSYRLTSEILAGASDATVFFSECRNPWPPVLLGISVVMLLCAIVVFVINYRRRRRVLTRSIWCGRWFSSPSDSEASSSAGNLGCRSSEMPKEHIKWKPHS